MPDADDQSNRNANSASASRREAESAARDVRLRA